MTLDMVLPLALLGLLLIGLGLTFLVAAAIAGVAGSGKTAKLCLITGGISPAAGAVMVSIAADVSAAV